MTLRQHLEAIRDRHALENVGSDSHLCIWCGSSDFPCHDRADAVAALAILDAADRDVFDHETGMIRIVPDYRPGVDQPHHAPGWTRATS